MKNQDLSTFVRNVSSNKFIFLTNKIASSTSKRRKVFAPGTKGWTNSGRVQLIFGFYCCIILFEMSSLEKLKKFRQNFHEFSDPIKQNLQRIEELDKECMEKQRFVEQLAIPVVQNWTKSRRDLRQKRYKSLKVWIEIIYSN